MRKRNIIIIAVIVAVLLAIVGAVLLLITPFEDGDGQEITAPTTNSQTVEIPTSPTDSTHESTCPTEATQPGPEETTPTEPAVPTEPTKPAEPTNPTEPTKPAEPTNPTEPTKPAEPTKPTEPTEPTEPDVPVENPNVRQPVTVTVIREDGTPAPGAAVIATHSEGAQTYAPTDEQGVAVLHLPKGTHNLRLFLDGQHGNAEVTVVDKPVNRSVQLKEERTLYIYLGTSGGYKNLAYYGEFEAAIKSKYPNAVYLNAENRYDITPRDGDAMLTVEVFVEHYTSDTQYFAAEVWVNFNTYQEHITLWNVGEYEEELDMEFIDGNLCSIQVRNDYDYEYRNSAMYITESYYAVEMDWHLNRYTPWADAWGYGYNLQNVLSTSQEQWTKAPGAGKGESFFTDTNERRFHDYLTYMEQMDPYVDLWMSGKWNESIAQIASDK